MLARRKGPASPHDTDVRADYGGPAFCAGCHQFNFPVDRARSQRQGPGRVTGYTAHPMQDTVAQHARGPHARKECLGCHHAGATGHLFPGGHDAEMIGHAIRMDACRDSKALVVSLANTGAGHNVPTGDLHRHLVLRAWRASAPEALQEVTLGRRFEPDPGRRQAHDGRHHDPPGPDAAREAAIAAVAGAALARAAPRLHDRRVPVQRPRARRADVLHDDHARRRLGHDAALLRPLNGRCARSYIGPVAAP